MMDWILFVVGLAGFGLAGYWDLKTTEFPDWLPYSIILLALAIRGAFAFMNQDIWIFLNSAIIGSLFLGLGLLLYFTKQWGDGDAWLLGALAFLFPVSTETFPATQTGIFPFQAVMLFDFFAAAFIYIVIYSLALGVIHRKKLIMFKKSYRKESKRIYMMTALLLACSIAAAIITNSIGFTGAYTFLAIPAIAFGLMVFIKYAEFVEKNLFKRRIHVRDLQVGDVPVNEKWRVLKEDEVKKLKKKGGYIWVKEGVRMAPVFIITLLLTLFYGMIFF